MENGHEKIFGPQTMYEMTIFFSFQVFGPKCWRQLVCLRSLLMDWSLVYPLISFLVWFTSTTMDHVPVAVLQALSELDLICHTCVINICSTTSVFQSSLFIFSCMVGYINNTLSTANISDKRVSEDFKPHQMVTNSGINVTYCR